MMMRCFCYVMLFLLSMTMTAQNTLNVRINGAPGGSKFILEYFMEDSWKNLLSMEHSNGQATFISPFDHPGQYRIRVSSDPEKWGDFIISPDAVIKSNYSCVMDYKLLQKLPIPITGNPESEPYELLMPAYNKLTLNPDHLDRTSIEYLLREKNLFTLCDSIATAFPSTYTGSFITKILGAPISPVWQDVEVMPYDILIYNGVHQLDYVPFNNKNVVYHIGLIRKLNLLYDYYDSQNAVDTYTDAVMIKAMAEDNVSAFMFRFMLDKLIDHKDEEALTYFLTWYSTDCQENDHTTEETKKLLIALENCKPGKQIEMMSLPNVNDQSVAMRDVFAKNKVTIIMFWKTNCSHCREFKPELEELYKKYHQLGIEVYAIGTDKLPDEWRKVVKADNLPWPSVYLAAHARKDFNKRFPVPSTPTLMAVDSNGIILRRMIMRSKIESVLDELLLEVK